VLLVVDLSGWVAEGSIPSPRRRHHVDHHRTTGAAGHPG